MNLWSILALVKHCRPVNFYYNIIIRVLFYKVSILYITVEEEFSGLTLSLSPQWVTQIVFLANILYKALGIPA